MSAPNTLAPFPGMPFLAYAVSSPLRDSPGGSISVSFKHKGIADIINVERLCFIHWQFLGIQDAGGREKNYTQTILSACYRLNCDCAPHPANHYQNRSKS